MTGKAEAFLTPLAERPVAFRALVLVLGMAADNLARHKETLDCLCPDLIACPYN